MIAMMMMMMMIYNNNNVSNRNATISCMSTKPERNKIIFNFRLYQEGGLKVTKRPDFARYEK